MKKEARGQSEFTKKIVERDIEEEDDAFGTFDKRQENKRSQSPPKVKSNVKERYSVTAGPNSPNKRGGEKFLRPNGQG